MGIGKSYWIKKGISILSIVWYCINSLYNRKPIIITSNLLTNLCFATYILNMPGDSLLEISLLSFILTFENSITYDMYHMYAKLKVCQNSDRYLRIVFLCLMKTKTCEFCNSYPKWVSTQSPFYPLINRKLWLTGRAKSTVCIRPSGAGIPSTVQCCMPPFCIFCKSLCELHKQQNLKEGSVVNSSR